MPAGAARGWVLAASLRVADICCLTIGRVQLRVQDQRTSPKDPFRSKHYQCFQIQRTENHVMFGFVLQFLICFNLTLAKSLPALYEQAFKISTPAPKLLYLWEILLRNFLEVVKENIRMMCYTASS